MGEQILLILGPSGAGKSTLADYMQANEGMIHIDLDQDGDAAQKEEVKAGWEAFTTEDPGVRDPQKFVAEIRGRIRKNGSKGAAITCTSGVMPSIRPGATGWHLSKEYLSRMLHAGICTRVLYGTPSDCLKWFLHREKESGRNIGGHSFWNGNNAPWYDQTQFDVNKFSGLIVQAFADGHHRESREMFEEIQRRFVEQRTSD